MDTFEVCLLVLILVCLLVLILVSLSFLSFTQKQKTAEAFEKGRTLGRIEGALKTDLRLTEAILTLLNQDSEKTKENN